MLYTSLNWNMHLTQTMVAGAGNDRIPPFYKALSDCGVRVDVIDAAEPLDKYKVLVSPLMMTLEEGDLPARIADWVRGGGVWIVGPLSDIRTGIGTRYRDRPFGMLEELTGAKWLYGIPDRINSIRASSADGKPLGSTLWYDIYDAEDADVLARVSGGHSAIDGKACIVRRKVGKGQVILLGTFPDYDALKSLYTRALNEAGVENGKSEGELMVIPRVGDTLSGLILVEYAGKPAAYTLDKPIKCTKTGAVVEGKIDIEPYGIVILQNL